MFRRLVHGERRMSLEAVRACTPAEMAFYLDDDLTKVRPPEGCVQMTPEEREAYLRRLRSMTPRERLEAAKRGEL